jgi:hypothetical protein
VAGALAAVAAQVAVRATAEGLRRAHLRRVAARRRRFGGGRVRDRGVGRRRIPALQRLFRARPRSTKSVTKKRRSFTRNMRCGARGPVAE